MCQTLLEARDTVLCQEYVLQCTKESQSLDWENYPWILGSKEFWFMNAWVCVLVSLWLYHILKKSLKKCLLSNFFLTFWSFLQCFTFFSRQQFMPLGELDSKDIMLGICQWSWKQMGAKEVRGQNELVFIWLVSTKQWVSELQSKSKQLCLSVFCSDCRDLRIFGWCSWKDRTLSSSFCEGV